jgi:hypothetical protein
MPPGGNIPGESMSEIVQVQVISDVIQVANNGSTVLVEVDSPSDVIQVGYTQPGGSIGDKFYQQDFRSTTTVTVTHNLGKYPSVAVVNTFKEQVEAEIDYIDTNNLTVKFNGANTGTVFCN